MSSLFKRILSLGENPGIKLIVFDFDGTIADTRELLLRIIKKHLFAFNVSLTKDLLKFFGNAPLEHYIPLTGIPKELVRSVCAGIHDDFIKEHHKIKPCRNLMAIKEIDARKVIVSNNSTIFVEKSLNFLRAKFFDRVYGAEHFMGHDKAWMINKLRQEYKLETNQIIYVGDKDYDAEVAHKVGCYSVIIAGKASWSPKSDIIKKKPDYVISDLGKLHLVVRQINSEQLAIV